jgi:hypothetical protein
MREVAVLFDYFHEVFFSVRHLFTLPPRQDAPTVPEPRRRHGQAHHQVNFFQKNIFKKTSYDHPEDENVVQVDIGDGLWTQ